MKCSAKLYEQINLESQYDGSIEIGDITLNREIGTFESVEEAANAALAVPEIANNEIFDLDFNENGVSICMSVFLNGTKTMWEDGEINPAHMFKDANCTEPATSADIEQWTNNEINLYQKVYFIDIEALDENFDREEFENAIREITGF